MCLNASGMFVASEYVEMVKTIVQSIRSKHLGIFQHPGTLGWGTTCLELRVLSGVRGRIYMHVQNQFGN